MTTVLVTPGEDGVTNETNADHIHHITDDLAHWLTKQTAPDAKTGRNG